MKIVSNTEKDGYPAIQQINSSQYRLYEDYEYVHRDCFEITIKKGFHFDGASIPRLLWRVAGTPFTGKYTVAALMHDALYSIEAFDRKECDLTFLEIMEDYGVNWFSRITKYYAVRWFGWIVWLKHNLATIENAQRYIEVH